MHKAAFGSSLTGGCPTRTRHQAASLGVAAGCPSKVENREELPTALLPRGVYVLKVRGDA
jgi:hypothetical protein